VDGGARTLAGRYELAAVIGRGGMGTVYRANDLLLGRTVAVKVLPAALAEEDPTHVARFEREARAAASLTHPGVVAVYDAGHEQATRFIVMEFVAGRSLAAILADEAPLEPARAAGIAARVADALGAAHAAGIVHRDVKPANVMLTPDGSVKVLDFGIARAVDSTALTRTGSVLGTAAYMAPEHALGGRGDERSDIYSLGCLLYALLTGQPPFATDLPAAVLHQHVNTQPRPPSDANSRVSPTLDALVMQMLAKAPDARPQSAGEVRDRLGKAQSAQTAAAVAPITPTARLPATTATRVMPGVARTKGRRAAAAAALTGAVLLIAILALASGGGSPPPASTASHTATATTSPATGPSRTNTSPAGPTTATTPAVTRTLTSQTRTDQPPSPAKPVKPVKNDKHGKAHGKPKGH
jgi:serine/threonine protein kinase